MARRAKDVGNQFTTYRGFSLVEVGANYYQACRGAERLPVGAVYHGDRYDLQRRFVTVVDKALGTQESEEDGE